jgi:hypothetical protein
MNCLQISNYYVPSDISDVYKTLASFGLLGLIIVLGWAYSIEIRLSYVILTFPP